MLSTRPLADIPPFNNVQNEIFDMVKPAISEHITLKDLINWFVCLFLNEFIEIHENDLFLVLKADLFFQFSLILVVFGLMKYENDLV